MSKIVINVNASSLKHSSCLKRWYRTIVEGYVEPTFSSKIVYGIAVHKFLDTMYQTNDLLAAKDAGLLSFRQPKLSDRKAEHMDSEQHFMWTCFDVWNNYALQDHDLDILIKPDGKPATEVTFSIPFYEDDTIIVNLCGTIDTIGKIKNGIYCIRDWKSTSGREDSRYMDKYLSSYSMSSQLRFYVLSLKLMARHFPDSQLGKIGASRVGAFIDGIFLMPKPAAMAVKRSECFQFKDQDLSVFENALVRRIKQLSQAIADGSVLEPEGIALNTCEGKWRKCSFYIACGTGNQAIEAVLLKKDFKQITYDPLHRDI